MHVQMILGVLDLAGLEDLHPALEAAARPYLSAHVSIGFEAGPHCAFAYWFDCSW